MTISVFKRYERKFCMDEACVRRLLPVIKEHMEPDKFCRAGQTYPISNLYFDTEGYDVIRESLAKPYYKEKLRMRSYGPPRAPEDPVFLEMKKKVDGMVTKRRVRLSCGQARNYLEGRQRPPSPDYMSRQVLYEIDYYLHHKAVKPVMMISYDRLAFFDRDNPDFRLTFDANIRFQCLGGRLYRQGDLERPLMPQSFRLMEVKVSESFPFWFVRLLSEEKVRRGTFSKYGVAYKRLLKERVFDNDSRIDVLARI